MYEDKAKIFKTSVESLYISRGQNNMVPMKGQVFLEVLILIPNNKNLSDLQGKYPNEILDGNKYLWKNICIVKVLDVLGRGKGAEYIINVIYYIYLNNISRTCICDMMKKQKEIGNKFDPS